MPCSALGRLPVRQDGVRMAAVDLVHQLTCTAHVRRSAAGRRQRLSGAARSGAGSSRGATTTTAAAPLDVVELGKGGGVSRRFTVTTAADGLALSTSPAVPAHAAAASAASWSLRGSLQEAFLPPGWPNTVSGGLPSRPTHRTPAPAAQAPAS